MPTFIFYGGTLEESSADGGMHKFLVFLIDGAKKEIPLWEAKSNGLVSVVRQEPINTGTGTTMYGRYVHVYESAFSVAKVMLYHKMPNRMKFSHSFFFFMAPSGREYTIRPHNDRVAESEGWLFRSEGRFLRTPELKTVIDNKSLTYRLAITQGLPSKEVIRRIIAVRELDKNVCVGLGERKIRRRGLLIDPKKGE